MSLRNARYATGPLEAVSGTLDLADGRIAGLTNASKPESASISPQATVELSGFLILPGLINSHDHLQYGLHPNIGNPPYDNYVAWGDDIHASMAEQIARYKAIPRDARLWWGGLRNLLCGVTTVCHHDKLWETLRDPGFPLKVLARYAWAHSLACGGDVAQAYAASNRDEPFFIHACEGVDSIARDEFCVLDELGILEERTVLIHGLALEEESIHRLNHLGSSLVLCPSSNQFLYREVLDPALAKMVERVAIGNDSPLTAFGDLLDEMRIAKDAFRFSPSKLYESVTSSSASMLRLRDGEGKIQIGGAADLLVIRDTGVSPAQRLQEITWRDVLLVLVDGNVQLASTEMLTRLPFEMKRDLEALEIDGTVRWLRAPVMRLYDDATAVLGDDVRMGSRRMAPAFSAAGVR